MADRTLTQRELNRALLARQGLLDPLPTSLPKTLERIGGIQAQYAPSMYVGLWSRMRDLDEREALTRALERKTVIQATLLRSTIHLVSKSDYWPWAIATREARRRSWVGASRGGVSDSQIRRAAERLRGVLDAAGQITRKQVDELVGKPQSVGVGLWVDLVRVPPAGTWERRRADLYGLAEDWIGPPTSDDAEAATELLVRRYLSGFGPAAPPDIANWAGLGARDIEPALGRIELRRFQDEAGNQLVDLPRAPLPDPDTPAPVRFLPTWDATLLVHARRSLILPEEHRPKIFGVKTPASFPTFLVDGQVAGTWRYEKGRIDLGPFAKLDASATRALALEGERLADFHA